MRIFEKPQGSAQDDPFVSFFSVWPKKPLQNTITQKFWELDRCLNCEKSPIDKNTWRKVSARPRRTKVDWALEMEELR